MPGHLLTKAVQYNTIYMIKKLIFVQSQKHGLKLTIKLPQKKFYHQAIISSPNLDQMEDAEGD